MQRSRVKWPEQLMEIMTAGLFNVSKTTKISLIEVKELLSSLPHFTYTHIVRHTSMHQNVTILLSVITPLLTAGETPVMR